MGVIASKVRKTISLTGTLMGGYAEDLFHLLFRALPGRMIEDGYIPSRNGSMNAAAMAFMRDHGVLKDIYSESDGPAHKTAKGSKVTVRTVIHTTCLIPSRIWSTNENRHDHWMRKLPQLVDISR